MKKREKATTRITEDAAVEACDIDGYMDGELIVDARSDSGSSEFGSYFSLLPVTPDFRRHILDSEM